MVLYLHKVQSKQNYRLFNLLLLFYLIKHYFVLK